MKFAFLGGISSDESGILMPASKKTVQRTIVAHLPAALTL